jgi:AcrR family transcriptional regulator
MSDFVKREEAASKGARMLQRLPVQERSQQRIARALEAAEKLLLERGPEAASIPEIAVAAKVPRASIYQYYPDKFALFAQLAEKHMEKLKTHILAAQPGGRAADWRNMVRSVVGATAGFYNAEPVTSVLLLKGPFGDQDRAAHYAKDRELAELFRLMIASDKKAPTLPKQPDVVAIAIELAFAVLRYGYARDGTLSRPIRDEAVRAVIAYLSQWA